MRYTRGIVFLIFLAVFSANVRAQTINRVVAVVNEEIITQQDIDQLLAVLQAQYAQKYSGDELLARMRDVKKHILDQVIEDKLILSRAKELNIAVREEEVNKKLEYVKEGFPSEEEFYRTLEMQGVTVADLKKRYTDQIMMKKIVDFEVKSRVGVLPSEVSEYYEKKKEAFRQDEKYRVRHILIKAEDEVGFELAKVEIEGIHAKLKEGSDFSELAREYSQGPNRETGGDMGYIGKGEMLEELDKVIFSLKPGEFSAPVRTRIGYHIFKVEDIKPASYIALDAVQKDIKKMLFQKKLEERLTEWLDGLRKNAYISIK